MEGDAAALVRRIYAFLGMPLEDVEAEFTALLAPGAEYVNPPDALERGIRRGVEGWLVAARNLKTGIGESAAYLIDELVERGSYVFVAGFVSPDGTASGAHVEGTRTYGVWTLEDGKALRYQWFYNRDAAEQVFEELTGARPS